MNPPEQLCTVLYLVMFFRVLVFEFGYLKAEFSFESLVGSC